MPQAGMQHGIEESVWYDPHIGGDHGFVEWVRVVVDEQTLLATAEGSGSGMVSFQPKAEFKLFRGFGALQRAYNAYFAFR